MLFFKQQLIINLNLWLINEIEKAARYNARNKHTEEETKEFNELRFIKSPGCTRVLTAIAKNKNTSAEMLEFIARSSEADANIFAAILGNDNINFETFKFIAKSDKASLAILNTIVKNDKAEAHILAAVAGNKNMTDSAILMFIAGSEKADAHTLTAVANNKNITDSGMLNYIAMRDEADAKTFVAIATNDNTYFETLQYIAGSNKANLDALVNGYLNPPKYGAESRP